MKIFSIIFAIIFLLFCIVQFNDPDPFIWIAIYSSMVVVCAIAAFDYYPRRMYWILLVLFVAYSTMDIPSVLIWLKQDDRAALFDEVAKMKYLYIEETREFLGLMICVSVLVFYLVKSRRIVLFELEKK